MCFARNIKARYSLLTNSYAFVLKVKKTYRLEISKEMVFSAFDNAFSYPENERINFFADLRNCFYSELYKKILESEIPLKDESLATYTQLGTGKIIETHPILDKYHNNYSLLESLATRGFDSDSMSSSNRERDMTYFPSYYPFTNFDSFSIGNFAFSVISDNYDIEITSENGIYFDGYSYHISSRKYKCYFAILGLFLSKDLLSPITKKYYSEYLFNTNDLEEINFEYASYPILFINRVTGKLYTCSCFQNYFDINDDISRLSHSFDNVFKQHIKQIEIKDEICHMCTHKTPKLIYWGQSVFQKKYHPYFELYRRQIYGKMYPNWIDILPERAKENEIENIVRKIFNFPPVGKLGISENILFKIIDEIFINEKVIHHYRGKELEGLELDIFIPSRKLAVECQGEQHFEEFKHWGGKEGLRLRQLNDERKKILDKQIIILDKVYEESQRIAKGIIIERLSFLNNKKLIIKTTDLLPTKKFFNQLENEFCYGTMKNKLNPAEFESEKNKYLNSADAKLILYCLLNRTETNKDQFTIVTEETTSSNDKKSFKKLPEICKLLSISYTTLPDLFRKYEDLNIEYF